MIEVLSRQHRDYVACAQSDRDQFGSGQWPTKIHLCSAKFFQRFKGNSIAFLVCWTKLSPTRTLLDSAYVLPWIKKKYLLPCVLFAVLYIVIDVCEINRKNCGNEIKWRIILTVVNAITFISFTGRYEHRIDQLPNISDFIAKLVRVSHQNCKVTGSNPVEVLRGPFSFDFYTLLP